MIKRFQKDLILITSIIETVLVHVAPTLQFALPFSHLKSRKASDSLAKTFDELWSTNNTVLDYV